MNGPFDLKNYKNLKKYAQNMKPGVLPNKWEDFLNKIHKKSYHSPPQERSNRIPLNNFPRQSTRDFNQYYVNNRQRQYVIASEDDY